MANKSGPYTVHQPSGKHYLKKEQCIKPYDNIYDEAHCIKNFFI